MASRTQINAPLTNVARAYRNTSLIGLALAPIVPVALKEFSYPVFGKENLLAVDTRAPSGAPTPTIRQTVTPETGACVEHKFAVQLTDSDKRNDQVGATLRAPRVAMDVIMLRHEAEVAQLALNAANYPTGHKATLTSTGQWSHDDSDPAVAVLAAAEVIQRKTGLNPNTLVLAKDVANRLRVHPKLRAMLTTDTPRILSVEDLQRILGIPRILVGEAVSSDSQGTVSRLWSDKALLACVAEAPVGQDLSEHDPCLMKTFRQRGFPIVDEWMDADTDSDFKRTKDSRIVKITMAEAGYLWSDVLA